MMYESTGPSSGDEIGDSLRKWNQATVAAYAFDPDAAAFFTAAGITDDTQKSAVNQLVLDLKGFSLWVPMMALYPFVGGSEASHSICLKTPAQHEITWGGTVTHDANGITGNGTTGYGDLGIDPATELDLESCSFGVYSRTDIDEVSVDLGTDNGGSDTMWMFLKTSGQIFADLVFNGATGRIQVANSSSAGLFSNSRTATNAHSVYRNGASLGSEAGAGGVMPGVNLKVLACGHPVSTAQFFSTRNLAFAFVSDSGFDATQNANLSTAVQTFQTALGREV